MQQQPEFDYKKYLQLIDKHKTLFAVVALLVMTAAVVAAYVIPKKYEARSTVFIEKNVISELVKGIAVTPSMEDSIKVLSHSITSRTLLLKVMNELDMTAGKNEAEIEGLIKEVQKSISVSIKDKNLFILTFKNGNPRIARDFINTLVRRYVEENVSSKREESYGAIKFLGEQLDTFREKMSKAETEVNAYKSTQGGVIAIDEGKLFEEINTAKQKLYDVELRRRHLEGLKPVARRASDPLQTKLVGLQKRLDELRVEYTDNYPEVVKLKSDIETLKDQMSGRKGADAGITDPQEMEKVEAELSALKMTEAGLRRHISMNEALLSKIPSAKAGLEKLELEKKNTKDLYDQLMARHGQSEVSKQMEVQDKTTTFRIVDPAVMPVQPVSPNRVRIILMGIIGGLGGALALLLGLDFLDSSVKNSESAKKFGVPVLAVIPRIIDPVATAQQRRKDLRLFAVSAAYLSIIIGILLTEVVGFSVIDKVIGKITHL